MARCRLARRSGVSLGLPSVSMLQTTSDRGCARSRLRRMASAPRGRVRAAEAVAPAGPDQAAGIPARRQAEEAQALAGAQQGQGALGGAIGGTPAGIVA